MSEPTGWSRWWRRKLGVVCIAAAVAVVVTPPPAFDGSDDVRFRMFDGDKR